MPQSYPSYEAVSVPVKIIIRLCHIISVIIVIIGSVIIVIIVSIIIVSVIIV